ncbi:MAG: hypothetical protein H6628_03210 [Calditrichae bacterium]|nr:hypothetical protein [Calditrichia bacterium]
MAIKTLFEQPLSVINLGLSEFRAGLTQASVPVVQVDWRPAAAVSDEARRAIAQTGRRSQTPTGRRRRSSCRECRC